MLPTSLPRWWQHGKISELFMIIATIELLAMDADWINRAVVLCIIQSCIMAVPENARSDTYSDMESLLLVPATPEESWHHKTMKFHPLLTQKSFRC